MIWNLSYTIAASGALFFSDLLKGFHMSIIASSIFLVFFGPSQV